MIASQVLTIIAFVLYGLAFGSFANVVIWRLPRGERLTSPPSRCPACGHPVRWHDNLPVVSWLVLRGACRDCGSPIAIRYPVVEAVSGALFGLSAVTFAEDLPRAIACAAFLWFLLVLFFIDLDTMRLPNRLVAALAGAGLLGALVAQLTSVDPVPLLGGPMGLLAQPVPSALAGAAAGIAFSAGIAVVYSVIRKAEGFGMGDVKLLGAMGLFLGVYVLYAFFVATLLGAVWGLGAAVAGKVEMRGRIPFGPFLAIGGLAAVLTGSQAVAWYLGIVGLG